MNIFHKVALQGLKNNRTRTLVTIIGVVLSTALFTAITTFGISLLHYMVEGAVMQYGDWHAGVLDVPAAVAQQCEQDTATAHTATFAELGYATLPGGQNPGRPYLFVAGYDDNTFETLPVSLFAGRLPQNDSEILVSAGIAAKAGVKLSMGDTLTLALGDRVLNGQPLGQTDPYAAGEALTPRTTKTYTVVGSYLTLEFANPYKNTAAAFTCITKVNSAAVTDPGARYSVFVKLNDPHTIHSYLGRTAGAYPSVLNEKVLRFMGLSEDALINSLLIVVGGVAMLIIMVGSVFLIRNAFNISLNERTHQFGILMSVGATAKQLRGSVLFEGVCIGAVGIPVGLLLGLGGMQAVLAVVENKFQNMLYEDVPLTMTISAPALLLAAAVSLVTILISAYLPAKKAAATPVMDCIRQSNEVKLEAKAIKTPRWAQRLYGLEGTIALKNFKRNKRPYRSVILSLVLSMLLFITTNAFVTALNQASEMAVVFTNYDIALDAGNLPDDELAALYSKMKNADGVTTSGYQELLDYGCTVNAAALTEPARAALGAADESAAVDVPFTVQFLDDATYQSYVQAAGLPEADYTGAGGKLIAIAKLYNDTERLQEVEACDDLFADQNVTVTATPQLAEGEAAPAPQKLDLTIVQLVMPDSIPKIDAPVAAPKPYVFQVLAPWSRRAELAVPGAALHGKGMTFSSENPAQTMKVLQTLLASTPTTADCNLWHLSKIMDDNNNMIFIANVFANTFVAMISLIAVANVFNTISTNIKLRRRELAMFRSVGMSERSFRKMMNFECLFYGLRALAWGLPLSAVAAWLVYKALFIGGAEAIDFVFPWRSMLVSTLGVFTIVFITMLYATDKIKKENIIDALRDDMA
ncbi:MAG: ABC transporter permease [Gemmiger sp.]|nr:ABC transporter permease [Gemmiger sp.]